MTLRFAGYTPPAGYTVAKAEVRASYDSNDSCSSSIFGTSCSGTPSAFELVGFASSGGCTPTQNVAQGTDMQAQTYDESACLTTARLASTFDIKWHAKANCGSGTCTANEQLDGIEVIVTLTPTDPNAKLRPGERLHHRVAELRRGRERPRLRVGQGRRLLHQHPLDREGRFSIKGTGYLPSGVIDIDDADVVYPFFSRGLIARHLRLKSFKYRSGYNEPLFNNWIDTTPSERQVMFYACVKAIRCVHVDGLDPAGPRVRDLRGRHQRSRPSRTGPSRTSSSHDDTVLGTLKPPRRLQRPRCGQAVLAAVCSVAMRLAHA